MDGNRTTMTIILTEDDYKALERMALDGGTTASALVSQWLHEHMVGDAAGAAGGPACSEQWEYDGRN